jgi:hypothetical protein
MQLAPLSLAGTTQLEGTDLRYRAERTVPATLQTVGIGVRLAIAVTASSYAGAEVELGSAMSSAHADTMTLAPEPITASQRGYGQAVAVLGVRHELAGTRLAAELAGGVRATPVTAWFADDPETTGDHATTLAMVARPLVEARVRATRWLSPWLSAGAFAGADVTGGGFALGLSLGAHLRAFDGGR